MVKNSQVYDKAFDFAVDIVNLYRILCKKSNEDDLFKQILRSGTSIGANIREALEGQSKKDFIAKNSIALKEAAETEYWLELFTKIRVLEKNEAEKYLNKISEIIKMLSKIIITSKKNLNDNKK
jgi:four helix bundle protein